MAIISVSLPEEMVRELDRLQDIMGTGRSEVIRAGIREVSKIQERQLGEKSSAILTVTHKDMHDHEVTNIKEGQEELIKTHMHSKIDSERCVDVFMLDGSGAKIRAVTNTFLGNKKMDTVELIIL